MSISSAQSTVTSVQREIQSLNRKLADLARDEAAISSKIASISKSITKSTSLSSLASKQQQVNGLQDDVARIQSRKANVSKDIATRTERLHKAQRELFNAQQREQKKSFESIALKSRMRDQAAIGQLHDALLVTPTVRNMTDINHYDAFISHATEDKEELVRPLAEELRSMGHSVWYDEFQLRVGDSLRRSIDKGLATSRFGIVVLSPSFFAKQWPQYELDGLVAKEIVGGKVILPLWHKVSKSEVIGYSPTLADKMALNTASFTVAEIAKELSSVLNGQ